MNCEYNTYFTRIWIKNRFNLYSDIKYRLYDLYDTYWTLNNLALYQDYHKLTVL